MRNIVCLAIATSAALLATPATHADVGIPVALAEAETPCVAQPVEQVAPSRHLAYPSALPGALMAGGTALLAGVAYLYVQPSDSAMYLDSSLALQVGALTATGVGLGALLVGLGLAASNHVVTADQPERVRPTLAIGPAGGAISLAGAF